MALVKRFYDPVRDSIEVDGRPPIQLSPTGYRDCFALAQQGSTLHRGTVRDDISYRVPGASLLMLDERIEEARRAVDAWDFESSLAESLSTQCNNSGNQSLGGQRQHLTVARALIRNPRVLSLTKPPAH